MAPTTSFVALIATALLAAQSVSANGCFSGGETFGQVTSDQNALAQSRTDACNSFAGTYPQGASRTDCINFPSGHSIKYSVTNNSGRTQTLSASDCVAAMTIEMNACSRGSKQTHGAFLYEDDPNANLC